MATLTEMVASVVLYSSAAAFSHFGVTLEVPRAQPPAAERRVVARSPRKADNPDRLEKAASTCPDAARDHIIKT